MDVLDYYRGDLSPRRLRVLLDQLPAHSRTKARLSGDLSGDRWGSVEHLLSSLLDLAGVQRIEHRVIAGDKKPPAFKPVERPGAAARTKAAEEEAVRQVELLRRKPKGDPDG